MTVRRGYASADPNRFYQARDKRQLTERYDEAAEVYDEAMTDDFGWSGHIELARAVIRHVSPDVLLCDAGAGTGMLGERLAARGFSRMVANDLSPGMLEIARRKGIYEDCQVMDLGRRLPYASDTFDAVTACGVFTPNHAPASALDELVRITRPDGLVLYTLRSDVEPDDFATRQRILADSGAWMLVETSEPFASIASEPHIRHRCWIWRIL